MPPSYFVAPGWATDYRCEFFRSRDDIRKGGGLRFPSALASGQALAPAAFARNDKRGGRSAVSFGKAIITLLTTMLVMVMLVATGWRLRNGLACSFGLSQLAPLERAALHRPMVGMGLEMVVGARATEEEQNLLSVWSHLLYGASCFSSILRDSRSGVGFVPIRTTTLSTGYRTSSGVRHSPFGEVIGRCWLSMPNRSMYRLSASPAAQTRFSAADSFNGPLPAVKIRTPSGKLFASVRDRSSYCGFHLKWPRTTARAEASLWASNSGMLWIRTDAPANWSRPSVTSFLSKDIRPNRRGIIAFSRVRFSCIRFAVSFLSPSISRAWIRWSFQLFQRSLIPKYDSPATPTTTTTPKIADPISSHLIRASSDDLSISSDATLYVCLALFVVLLGLVSLVIPVLAVMSLLARRANRNSN
jgi:hypothetical protein